MPMHSDNLFHIDIPRRINYGLATDNPPCSAHLSYLHIPPHLYIYPPCHAFYRVLEPVRLAHDTIVVVLGALGDEGC